MTYKAAYGDTVNMPLPNKSRGDFWRERFTGTITGFRTGGGQDLVAVTDQDGDTFEIERPRLEKYNTEK